MPAAVAQDKACCQRPVRWHNVDDIRRLSATVLALVLLELSCRTQLPSRLTVATLQSQS